MLILDLLFSENPSRTTVSTSYLERYGNERVFYKKEVFKKMIIKWSNSKENLKKITGLNFSFSIGQKLIFRRYCIESVKDGIQIQVYS